MEKVKRKLGILNGLYDIFFGNNAKVYPSFEEEKEAGILFAQTDLNGYEKMLNEEEERAVVEKENKNIGQKDEQKNEEMHKQTENKQTIEKEKTSTINHEKRTNLDVHYNNYTRNSNTQRKQTDRYAVTKRTPHSKHAQTKDEGRER